LNHLENINKICAVIPFFNEEENLKILFHKVIKFVDCIIAVNDGSTDNSVYQIPQKDNIILLNHKKNLGKGRALRSGFLHSIKLNTHITITLDADMQHLPELIPSFVEQIHYYDVVIGNRLNNTKSMPIQRKISNYLTSKLLSWKTGEQILDSQSGYRAFRTSILQNIMPDRNGFEAESEMIVKILNNNYKIGYIDIPTLYNENKSKINAWQTIKGFLNVIITE